MGIAWLFSSIVFGEAELSVGRSPKSFGIVLIVFTGMLFITIVTFCCFFNNLNRLWQLFLGLNSKKALQ